MAVAVVEEVSVGRRRAVGVVGGGGCGGEEQRGEEEDGEGEEEVERWRSSHGSRRGVEKRAGGWQRLLLKRSGWWGGLYGRSAAPDGAVPVRPNGPKCLRGFLARK